MGEQGDLTFDHHMCILHGLSIHLEEQDVIGLRLLLGHRDFVRRAVEAGRALTPLEGCVLEMTDFRLDRIVEDVEFAYSRPGVFQKLPPGHSVRLYFAKHGLPEPPERPDQPPRRAPATEEDDGA